MTEHRNLYLPYDKALYNKKVYKSFYEGFFTRDPFFLDSLYIIGYD